MVGTNKFTGVNSIKFNRAFSNDDDCYQYLEEIKWEGIFDNLIKMMVKYKSIRLNTID